MINIQLSSSRIDEGWLKSVMSTEYNTMTPLEHTDGKEYAVKIPKYVCNYSQDAEWVTKLSMVDYDAGVACGNIPCFCPKGTIGRHDNCSFITRVLKKFGLQSCSY